MCRLNVLNIVEKMLVFYSPGNLLLKSRKGHETKTLFLAVTEREFSSLIKTQKTPLLVSFLNVFSPTGVNQVDQGNA